MKQIKIQITKKGSNYNQLYIVLLLQSRVSGGIWYSKIIIDRAEYKATFNSKATLVVSKECT